MQLAPTDEAPRLEGPLPLEALTERVRTLDRRCHDHAGVVLGHTRMEGDGRWAVDGITAHLTRHALGQLCGRLALPHGGTVPAATWPAVLPCSPP
jgi:hypothetical protein